ncbi:ribosomal P protein AGP2beta-1, putative [Leishmania panamensis]|uniref:Ribosomal P protein AGP2beta-1, putative n=2 Tax=Leishmania guyanensis species complex TaxID=38579 RepID=A0A088SFL8_LEIPA|nr:ribosomal P protein AGP2beta-1, putative [Leishmania panamensis]AIO00592.1 ribosomal P protein AGP2beta-1, putative [Leishmania panamensis]
MALQENKDSYNIKALSLSEFVLQCSDCHRLCLEKTARVLENRSRAPRGWEGLFSSVAEQRRFEDLDLCESRCHNVQAVCPSNDKVREYEQALAAASLKPKNITPPNPSLLQAASRCQHAVEVFSNVLFALAHKPSKVSFPIKDPAKGEGKGSEPHDGAPTETHRKVLAGATNMNSEILRRGRKGHQDQLIPREEDIASSTDSDWATHTPTSAPGLSGTTPKW